MKKTYQTIRDFINGDCMRACVASALEVEISHVDNFMKDGNDNYRTNLDIWTDSVGLLILGIMPGDAFIKKLIKKCYCIGIIDSPRNKNEGHAVLIKNGVIAHDPYSANEPIGKRFKGKTFEVIIIQDVRKFYNWKLSLQNVKGRGN